GGDFVADEQDIEFVGEVAELSEETGWLDDHAACALDDGFDAEGGDLAMVLIEDLAHCVDGGPTLTPALSRSTGRGGRSSDGASRSRRSGRGRRGEMHLEQQRQVRLVKRRH